jgi:Fe-S cluster assembly protein SufB
MNQTVEQVQQVISQRYKAGFYTDIESDRMRVGLDEEIIAMISAKKNEPAWMLEWRLKAFITGRP